MGPGTEGMGRSGARSVRAFVGLVATGDPRGPGGFPLDHGHASLSSSVSSPPPSLLSPLMMRNLEARGREACFDPQIVRDAVREGLEQNFLLSQGQAFIPSPVSEAIIALDHSLQV